MDFEKTESDLGNICDLLKEILDKHNEKYFSYFTYCLYNYETWFIVKKSSKKSGSSKKC